MGAIWQDWIARILSNGGLVKILAAAVTIVSFVCAFAWFWQAAYCPEKIYARLNSRRLGNGHLPVLDWMGLLFCLIFVGFGSWGVMWFLDDFRREGFSGMIALAAMHPLSIIAKAVEEEGRTRYYEQREKGVA
jgi:hypothetical protein